jgi:hypothetical protein
LQPWKDFDLDIAEPLRDTAWSVAELVEALEIGAEEEEGVRE